MEKIAEDLQVLDELIRRAYDLISPLQAHDDLIWLTKRDMRTKHLEKYPKCWKSINKQGREIPFFPICNRMGIEDPNMIDKSMKIADRLKDKPDIDQDKLLTTLKGLQSLKIKFSKSVPKPMPEAIKKSKVTRGMNKVSKYIKGLR